MHCATMHADNRLNDNNRSIRGSDIRGLGPTLGTLVIIIGKISIIHDCLPIIARFIRGVSETREDSMGLDRCDKVEYFDMSWKIVSFSFKILKNSILLSYKIGYLIKLLASLFPT